MVGCFLYDNNMVGCFFLALAECALADENTKATKADKVDLETVKRFLSRNLMASLSFLLAKLCNELTAKKTKLEILRSLTELIRLLGPCEALPTGLPQDFGEPLQVLQFLPCGICEPVGRLCSQHRPPVPGGDLSPGDRGPCLPFAPGAGDHHGAPPVSPGGEWQHVPHPRVQPRLLA